MSRTGSSLGRTMRRQGQRHSYPPRPSKKTVGSPGRRSVRTARSGAHAATGFGTSVLADEADDDTLDLDAVGGDDDRRHRRVRGLKADRRPFAIDALERGVAAVDERKDRLAVARERAFFDDDVIPLADLLVDHRIALDLEDEGAGATRAH